MGQMTLSASLEDLTELRRRNARLNHARLCSDLVTQAKTLGDIDPAKKAAHVGYLLEELEAAVSLNRGTFLLIEGGLNGP